MSAEAGAGAAVARGVGDTVAVSAAEGQRTRVVEVECLPLIHRLTAEFARHAVGPREQGGPALLVLPAVVLSLLLRSSATTRAATMGRGHGQGRMEAGDRTERRPPIDATG